MGQTGTTGAPRRRVTLQDVAAAAGVSKSLASRALAAYPDIAPTTRERVARLAAALGYRPSARARALAAGRNAPARCLVVSLGLSSAALGRTIYGDILTGITAQASVEGLDVHLASVSGEKGDAAALLAQLVAEDRADGVILLTFMALTPDDVRPLDEARIPYVLANRHFGGHPVNCVTPDWAGATGDAVERLFAQGHRRLALLLPAARGSTVQDHEAGWAAGRERCSVPTADAPILTFAGHEERAAYDFARGTFARWARHRDAACTAIVCMNDAFAHGVLAAAAEAGVAVPERLSVLGFDDTVARYLTPPLCSFDPHLYDVGAQAATLLATALRGEFTAPQRIVTPLDFVCRASCGPAPDRGPWGS